MSGRPESRLRRRVTALLLAGFAGVGCSGETPVEKPPGAAGTPSAGGAAGGTTGQSGMANPGGGASPGGGGNSPRAGSNSSGAAGDSGAGGTSGGGTSSFGCETPGLTWKTANKTWYTSYPDPGSEECIEYNGCTWAGQFAGCESKRPEAWVKEHDIAAAFPAFDALALHDLCLKSGDKTLVVTVLDTCADEDCDGCCTANQGDADALIDLESYTNQRWGVEDGPILWADLGPTRSGGCSD